ncbi:MAG: hypothetical protein IKU44_02680 [Firmicutes bacterium]|nr:hypothetical protein [Bacillota bacterium]
MKLFQKKSFVLLLILMLAVSCCGCKTDAEKEADRAKKNWAQTTNEDKMSIYCALIKEYMLLTDALGENTPYPAMKRSVKGSMMSSGLTMDEALENAKQVIIQEQAIFWYGEKVGIVAGDEEVANFIKNNVLVELKASETYEAVDEACNKEGITFEDTIWAYESSYKMQYILKEAGVKSEDEIAFVNDLVEDYGETEAYALLMTVLDTCGEFIKVGETDKDVLKSADIYMN